MRNAPAGVHHAERAAGAPLGQRQCAARNRAGGGSVEWWRWEERSDDASADTGRT